MPDLLEVIQDGDRRRSLEAIRDRLATELDDTVKHDPGCPCECGSAAATDGRVIATLAQRLAAVLAEIDSLPDAGKGSVADDLAQKRAARRAAASAV